VYWYQTWQFKIVAVTVVLIIGTVVGYKLYSYFNNDGGASSSSGVKESNDIYSILEKSKKPVTNINAQQKPVPVRKKLKKK
jgi:uncharacterized protein (UPF0333 family)